MSDATQGGNNKALKVGVVGASGFAGAELLRLIACHPHLELHRLSAGSQVGTPLAVLYPNLAAVYQDLVFGEFELEAFKECDVVFCALPHRVSQHITAQLIDHVEHICDLSADFRIEDSSVYEHWYATKHESPELIERFAYGIPELFSEQLQTHAHVAVPGCYPTAAGLALVPFAHAHAISLRRVIVDAASGASGAGRAPKDNTTFCAVDENFSAYGVGTHRHTPEIEQSLGEGANVIFTPHLAPMSRGILATCYADLTADISTNEALEILHSAYADEPFVHVSETLPQTKAVTGSNCAHLSARVDQRTGTLLVFSAIDNLVKGTAGQAIQCLNILRGWDQTTGLPLIGLLP